MEKTFFRVTYKAECDAARAILCQYEKNGDAEKTISDIERLMEIVPPTRDGKFMNYISKLVRARNAEQAIKLLNAAEGPFDRVWLCAFKRLLTFGVIGVIVYAIIKVVFIL